MHLQLTMRLRDVNPWRAEHWSTFLLQTGSQTPVPLSHVYPVHQGEAAARGQGPESQEERDREAAAL